MDLITLGRTLGFSFAAGVNLYATVAILGLAARYGWVDLPAQFQSFNHPVVIGAAIVMYLIEFFADKIPYVDTVWDLIHTAIRPVGGALIAVATLGDASAPVEGLIALLGGTVAASSHLTKTSTRAVANTSLNRCRTGSSASARISSWSAWPTWRCSIRSLPWSSPGSCLRSLSPLPR